LKENREVDLSSLVTKSEISDFRKDVEIQFANASLVTKSEISEFRKDVENQIANASLVTKSEISDFRKDVDTKFSVFRHDVDSKFSEVNVQFALGRKDIAELETRMMKEVSLSRIETIKWTVGTIIAMSAFLTGVMTYLLRTLK
jgi:hypothetical protein